MTRVFHGLKGHHLYWTWRAMVRRCTTPSAHNYARYGGRGITVCPEWLESPAQFIADMEPTWSEGLSLDRIDNARGYGPDNCRWVTATEQNRNQRSNRMITHNGETLCLAEWAERAGLRRDTVGHRLRRGWSLERAITEPAQRGRKSRNTTNHQPSED